MCCQDTAAQDNLCLARETAQLPLEDKVTGQFLTSLCPHQDVNFAQMPQAVLAGPSFQYGGLLHP